MLIARPLRLLVIGRDATKTFPLPPQGEVSIGTSPRCHVHVTDPAMAPEHLLLRLGPENLLVDVARSGGTRVGARQLVPGDVVPLAAGVPVVVGSTTMIIQQAASAMRLRHIRSHGYFEQRLEDECARAEATAGGFVVLRVRCEADTVPALEEALGQWLRPMDVVATYSPDQYEVLLVDGGPAEAAELEARLRASLAGRPLHVGIAAYPADARTPESLVARSGAAAVPPEERVGRAGGRAEKRHEAHGGAIDRLRPLIERVAVGTISVLVTGETGVGKEVVARLIHELSPRARQPLYTMNCAAMTETLLESELFGYERGAFTGAVQAKPGLLETADGGTVFLDEAGEMPLALQAKLLRVLEDRRVLRLGAVKPRTIDVRFIAATNRDLEAEVERGSFRADLYFRLCGVSVMIPPLRERIDEIETLAELFIDQYRRALGRQEPLRLSTAALELMQRHAWPGNVRELRNVIERAVLLATGDVIRPEHLPAGRMRRHALPGSGSAVGAPPPSVRGRPAAEQDGPRPPSSVPPAPAADTPGGAEERARIVAALEQCAGNQSEAARLLGIARRTLVNRIEQYGLPRPRKRGAD